MIENTEFKNEKTFSKILIFVICSGIVFSVIQFIVNRSLWLDEAMLALNIVEKSYSELLQPLDRKQSAPIGFLWIQNFLTNIFGNADYSLRLFPLLSFFATLFFFFKTTKILTGSNFTALFTTALLSINKFIIYYATEAKQYSVDVLVCVLVLYAYVIYNPKSNKSALLFSLIGITSVWFTNISIIVLFSFGLFAVYKHFIKNRDWKIIVIITSWVISFGIYYFSFIHNHPLQDFMTEYWSKSFLPTNVFSAAFYTFLLYYLKEIYFFVLAHGPLWIIPFAISILAIYHLIKQKKYELLYLLLAPVFLHLILSGLKLYPIYHRFLMYFAPLLLMLFTIGILESYNIVKKRFTKLHFYILLLPILFMYIPLLRRYPMEKQEMKKALAHIENNISEEQKIYLYHASQPAFEFYEKNYKQVNNASKLNGIWSQYKWDEYLDEIQTMKGENWIIFSHVYTFNETGNEESYTIEHLKKAGIKILSENHFAGTSVYKISN